MASKKLIAAEQTSLRKRPKREEEGVNPIFAQLDWALSNSSLVGDLSVDTTTAGYEQKKGQKGKKKGTPKPKEIPSFFPKSLYPLFGQPMDVFYTPSHPISEEKSEVWVSGYLVLDPLRKETRYPEEYRNKIIRGLIPLVLDRGEDTNWSKLLLLPSHLTRPHDASTAKTFKDVFGVIYL